ncbi:hypothetical protein [Vagococcus silagei]|uniref:Uncharacterized protein n=1 Tax=Vagococcus silagei TaxID=2508885 RepID=A0A4S3B868_9ENTE|nr:hypothetical protein [Vagococcus silagei]THB61045.1 hypothetical protein ESZ54_06845 [Vagococcus silagei]
MIDKFSTDPNDTPVQQNKFKRFLSESSQKFLASFLDDDLAKDKRKQQIFQTINQAIAQKSIVVIQYKDSESTKTNAKHETLVGRLYQHPSNPESLVVKLKKNNQVKMISAQYIQKISVASHGFSRATLANK